MPLARTTGALHAQAAVEAAAHSSAREGLHAWVVDTIAGGVSHVRMRPFAAAAAAAAPVSRCSRGEPGDGQVPHGQDGPRRHGKGGEHMERERLARSCAEVMGEARLHTSAHVGGRQALLDRPWQAAGEPRDSTSAADRCATGGAGDLR